jgi:sulfur carrier protein
MFSRSRHRHKPRPLPQRNIARHTVGMDILLNGEPRRIDPGATLAELLEEHGLAGRRVAVEVNGEIVPRGLHGEHRLQEGDRIEIVHALGGG